MTNKVNVSLLVTFHGEGILAHSTLNSLARCRQYAESYGITSQYVWVFDSATEETKQVVLSHKEAMHAKWIFVEHKDSGMSRNAGIQVCDSDAIAILDGDDYYSTNWIERAWFYLNEYGYKAIVHPEFIVNFGVHHAYGWQMDQQGQYFNKNGLLVGNYWTSWTFAHHTVYRECPYICTKAHQTGFGFEDWHWNCETIANGYEHRLARGSIGFYRRKKISRVTNESSVNALLPPTQLFNKGFSL